MDNETSMLKMFIKSAGFILLYMILWVPPLLLWIIIWGDNDSVIAIGVLIATALIVIIFIPYLNFAIKKVFFFRGIGDPVTEEQLRATIVNINESDAPVFVNEKNGKFVVTWKYVDATWWEILAKAGLTKLYELHLKFIPDRSEVILIDVTKSVSWRAGPSQVQIRGGFFRGVDFEYEIGKQWGIREIFSLGKVYDYKFTPSEIKNPILNSILKRGWNVRFAIW